MDEDNANSVVNTDENANANSQEVNKGTQETDNSKNDTLSNVDSIVDYKKKFSESSAEAQRLFAENKRLRELTELKDKEEEFIQPQNTDNLYPGFEELDEDARKNLIAYTNMVTKKAKEELYRDPAIAFSRKQYNEGVWDSAFNKVLAKYPDLANSKEEFKSRYFNVNNVPENIENILDDVAKIHLYDKAKEIGAKEQTEKEKLIDTERTTAGEKNTQARRSLEDWTRMAQENPAQFAKLHKEYNSDLASGKI